MVDEKSQAAGRATGEGEATLGKLLTASRKQNGFTPEQVAAGTHIPAHYIKALESDDYGLISDQLYMLPFLRKYAAFVGLDPEEIASRFVREVQKAESGAAKVGEPIGMIGDERKSGGGRYVLALTVALIAAVGVFLIERNPGVIEHLLRLAHIGSSSPTSASRVQPAPQSDVSDTSSEVPQSSVTAADSGEPPPEAPQNTEN